MPCVKSGTWCARSSAGFAVAPTPCACVHTNEDDRSHEAFISPNRVLPDMHKTLVVVGLGSITFFVLPLFAGFGDNVLALLWGPLAFTTGYLVAKWY